MSKYGNQTCVLEGKRFDSIREARRWQELRLMEKAGVIQDLRWQVKFVLVPPQAGMRGVDYVADFVYTENGKQVVEDAKGMKTKDYVIKKKLMLWMHGIRIKEV